MAFVWHDEGEEYLFQVGFSEEQSVPAAFYVGLCDDVLVEADGLADILNEPSTGAYSRQLVNSNDTDCVVTQDGDYYKVTFAQAVFVASGGNFGAVSRWFVGTTSDNAGKLLSSGDVTALTAILEGTTYMLQAYLRNK